MQSPLYDLEPQYVNLWRLFESGQEIDPIQLAEIVSAISAAPPGEVDQKIENLAHWIKELELNAELPRKEAKRLSDRARGYEELAERLRNVLQKVMDAIGVERVSSPLTTIRVQKGPPSVVSVDMSSLPSSLKKQPVIEPDKKAIIQQFKETGLAPNGTIIDDNRRHIVIS